MGKRALVIVDCQNDFCEGGSLAVNGGAEVVARIADFVESVASTVQADRSSSTLIVGTLDAHVDPGSHFSPAPDFVDSWPRHCVVGTEGAQPHRNLLPVFGHVDAWFAKGAHEAAYSGFEGRSTTTHETLDDYLQRHRVDAIEVVGLATDYCVAATCRSALQLRYSVFLRRGMCAAVDSAQGDHVLNELRGLGVTLL